MKAVIFDLDNTIIDFAKMKIMSIEAAVDTMIKNGLKMKKKEAIKKIFDLYDKHGWEYQKIFNLFLKKYHGSVDYSILAPAILSYREKKETLVYPYLGVKDTLIKLKQRKYKLAVVTDAPAIQAWMRLAAMNMHKKWFDVVITYDDSKKKKPDLKPFKLAIKKLRMKPQDITMVGDSFKKDMNPANKLGMNTVFAKYGFSTYGLKEYEIKVDRKQTKGKSDHQIKKFSDLLKILK